MTVSVVGRTNTPVTSEAYVRFAYPAGIALGDIALAQVGIASGGENLTVNWVNGWVRLGFVTSGTLGYMLAYKPLNGDESTEDESKDDSDSITAVTVVRGAGLQYGPRSASFTASTANPDPPALTIPWSLGDPSFYQASVVGAGTGAITGGDAAYTQAINAAGSRRVATEERITTSTSEDPTAWTRASAAYAARTVALPPYVAVGAPDILRIQSMHHTDALVHDYSLVIPDGERRALFVWCSSNATEIKLDPAGLNLMLSPVSDGTTTATTPNATDDLYGAWYRVDPDDLPAAGTYTLRYNPAAAANAQLFAVCLGNAYQTLQVHQVVKFWHAISAQDQDFDIGLHSNGGMLLWAARKPFAGGFISGGVYVYAADAPNNCMSDGIAIAALREIHANSSMHAALFARKYGPDRGGDTISNRIRLASAGLGGYLALSIGYAPPPTSLPGRVPLPSIVHQTQLDAIVANYGGGAWLAAMKRRYGIRLSAPDPQGLIQVTYGNTTG